MSEKLAMEILKQATIETTTGACEKCPRKDKNKTCIGCLNEAKDKALLEIERLNNIINELEEEISKHIALCTDITLNDILDKLKELKGENNE